MSDPKVMMSDWQAATVVMALGCLGPIEPGDALRERVRGEVARITGRVRGNRAAVSLVKRSDVALMVEATLRRAQEILEGAEA